MQPHPHYQRYLQPAAPFQQTFGPNTQAGIDLTNLIYAGLKTRQAAVEVVPPVDQQAEPASNTPAEPSLVPGADSTVQEEDVDFFKECMVQKEFPKVPTETAALEADLKSPIVSEGAEGNEAIEMPEMEEELSTAPWVGETGSNYPIFCGGLGAPDSEASSLQDGKICLETPVDALTSLEADLSPLPVESQDAAKTATSNAEVEETRVYAPSSMLRMRLATFSDAEATWLKMGNEGRGSQEGRCPFATLTNLLTSVYHCWLVLDCNGGGSLLAESFILPWLCWNCPSFWPESEWSVARCVLQTGKPAEKLSLTFHVCRFPGCDSWAVPTGIHLELPETSNYD